jgi:SHS2 domain-containing protein
VIVGTWQVLEAIAIADCALQIDGRDLGDLFATAAHALADVMVDPRTLAGHAERTIRLEASALDLLLYDWLSELIFLKDSEQLIFPRAEVSVRVTPPALDARIIGGRIDRAHTVLRADAKAVTLHQFSLEPRAAGWYARVIIDI